MKSFHIHRLGCPKNDVDADYISGLLKKIGLAESDNPEKADLLIVNSCAFIQPAKEESLDAVFQMVRLKEADPVKKIVLTGCLSQRYSAEIGKEINELDAVIGLNNIEDLEKFILGRGRRLISVNANPAKFQEYSVERALNQNEPFAYLKISEGCNNRCSYCAIPDIRGPFRSRPLENIVAEAENLLRAGKKEIILVSQESTLYGTDLYRKPRLMKLLDRLSALPGDYWIRIMYLHPARLTPELIDYIIDNQRICSYFDLPLQHIDDDILERMGRRVTKRQIEGILDRIASTNSQTAVRTNFIVGFPGESDENFNDLCRFVEERRFDRLGAFVYSAEEGTTAAGMPAQVPEKLKEKRFNTLMEIQREIAFEENDKQIGREKEVLVDRVDQANGQIWGRTRFDAPEIDSEVRLNCMDCRAGDFVTAKIIASEGYDLVGERG